jgi:hypothetical protein
VSSLRFARHKEMFPKFGIGGTVGVEISGWVMVFRHMLVSALQSMP